MEFLRKIENNKFKLNLWIQPGAKKNQIEGIYNNCLKVKIKAPPVDNKANTELINFFSKIFQIKKNRIEIVSGQKSRKKIILIKLENALDPMEILKKFLM